MDLKVLLMNAGILVAIIFAVVQILKQVLKSIGLTKLKEKHKTLYKFVLTILSLIVTGTVIVLNQLYIVENGFNNIDFIVSTLAVVAGVFLSYNVAYEGFGVRELVGIVLSSVKKLLTVAPESKLAKLVKEIGAENIDNIVKGIVAQEKKESEQHEIIE